MGYITDYYGHIKFSNKSKFQKVKSLYKKKVRFFELCEDFYFNDEELSLDIGIDWKDYDNLMEKVCKAISLIDKKCSGEIECSGEDKEDIWKIKIEEGNVKLFVGKIVYEERGEFDNLEVKKLVYEVTKDKELEKELMINDLEK